MQFYLLFFHIFNVKSPFEHALTDSK